MKNIVYGSIHNYNAETQEEKEIMKNYNFKFCEDYVGFVFVV